MLVTALCFGGTEKWLRGYPSAEKLLEILLMGMMLQLVVFLALPAASGWASDLVGARQLYQRTAYESALQALRAEDSHDAQVLLLAGQIYYQLGKYKEASEHLEKASEVEPGSAEIFWWLGRSMGRRAQTSSFITALGYAKRCRAGLERAVAVDGTHVQAMSDLAAYYLEAPGFLGGGVEKSEQLAARIAALDSSEGLSVQARIAEKRQDFSAAEAYLRRAADLAPRQIDRWIDLARFFARRGDVKQSEHVLAHAAEVMPEPPKLLFAKAEIYIQQVRHLKEAQALLQRYLQMPLTPEDPPRREAQRLLVNAGD